MLNVSSSQSCNKQVLIEIYTILCLVLFLFMISIKPTLTETTTEHAQRVKAAFIFNIARYVTWPEYHYSLDIQTVKLCFLEKNPFGLAIASIKNKHFGNKKMLVQYIPVLDKKFNCQILFLTQKQIGRIAYSMKNKSLEESRDRHSLLYKKNVLIMGDLSDSSQNIEKLDSIVIYLIRQGTNIGIEIIMQSLRNSTIKLSSQLLKLSKIN